MKNLAILTAVLAFALGLVGSALAASATQHGSRPTRHAARHHRHHRPAHRRTGIGPGGDQDADNHGAASDGDGNF